MQEVPANSDEPFDTSRRLFRRPDLQGIGRDMARRAGAILRDRELIEYHEDTAQIRL